MDSLLSRRNTLPTFDCFGRSVSDCPEDAHHEIPMAVSAECGAGSIRILFYVQSGLGPELLPDADCGKV